MPGVINTVRAAGAGFNQLLAAVRDVYSAEIYLSALPLLRFDQFVTYRSELGVQPGHTIKMPSLRNLKRGGRLDEKKEIETQAMSLSDIDVTVYEYGNGIAFSEMSLQSAFFDQMAAASILLGRDFAVVLDNELRNTMVSGAVNIVYANGVAARNLILAADVFSADEVKDAVETLETNNAPRWNGDHYVCIMHPHQARSMMDDGEWINASLYGNVAQIYQAEIGRYHDVRFISTTVMNNGANSTVDPVTGDFVDIGFDPQLQNGALGNTTTIYTAVMFGEFSLGHAVSLPVEMRDNGVENFGRVHALAWYSIYGQRVLETDNVVVIETA